MTLQVESLLSKKHISQSHARSREIFPGAEFRKCERRRLEALSELKTKNCYGAKQNLPYAWIHPDEKRGEYYHAENSIASSFYRNGQNAGGRGRRIFWLSRMSGVEVLDIDPPHRSLKWQ